MHDLFGIIDHKLLKQRRYNVQNLTENLDDKSLNKSIPKNYDILIPYIRPTIHLRILEKIYVKENYVYVIMGIYDEEDLCLPKKTIVFFII
ncbi:unnamed protein product [Gordionus sp. m RMFG-2023]